MDPNVFETANAGFAQAMYEEFLKNPQSVGEGWRRLFESGVVGEVPPAQAPSANGSSKRDGAQAERATPAARPAPTGEPIKGPAARLVQNMNESLTVPTATSFRELPVARLEAARKSLNSALQAAGRDTKVSFTHLIAYAIVQATKQLPVMGHTLVMHDGVPHRLTPDGVNLGLAVDVTRKDGSRGLVVPVIKHAETMDFAAFHAAYESLVEKSRTSKLMPDDFAGATMSLTNPGGLGTVASVPRLMAGQGSIIAVGAIGYPPEFAAAPPERIRELGLSKVMTVTSTYDHRVIQGAESGQFLGVLDGLLQGKDGFYESVAEQMGVAGTVTGGAVSTLTTPAAAPAAAVAPAESAGAASSASLAHVAAAMALIKAFRTHGHLAAHLDPLGTEPVGDPALDAAALGLTPEVMATIPCSVLRVYVPGKTLAEALPHLDAAYCGTIAYQIEHIASHEQRMWLREKIESGAFRQPLANEERLALLQRLIEVESFERFLHKAYLGQKRFSIEGVDMLVPMLDKMINLAADAGANEVVLGMAHRGRLNVLAHNVRRPYETIFAEFEGGKKALGTDDEGETGTGDVKYHHGAEGAFPTERGRAITVALSPNPSHLEFVGAVVDGRARARQTQRRSAEPHYDPAVAVPIVIHGDAAFAGQGVVAETFNLGNLPGYDVGGTLHIITNNQVGFTTDIRDARSTRYASDLAKGFDVPIAHVNADDPEACLAAVRLSMAYRERFGEDALIDLVGYRRHGHNEGDEPAYTQPKMYERIRDLPTVRQRYAATLVEQGVLTAEDADARYDAAYQHLLDLQQAFKGQAGSQHLQPDTTERRIFPSQMVHTAVPADQLIGLNEQLLSRPADFHVHPKLGKQLERRRDALARGEAAIDWAHAEALAFASLLVEGVPLRLTGQDTERGTFSHRHLVLHDVETGAEYAPIRHIAGAIAPFELHNSPLSELAAIGFEYGYSVAAPETLVLWEAQFGDFINGAQVMIDQFIAAGLSKWGQTSRLTLLLPHGYEGQGPEHSSARLERFLQLAAENNLRVANCSTPAQYFHLIRRQARNERLRPLVVMTPKSLLRLPAAASRLEELAEGSFLPVIDDAAARARAGEVSRVVLCSGKVYYDLLAEAEKLTEDRPAVVRVEQLYTFPEEELRGVLAGYPALAELVWAQEEPKNMGAWTYIAPKLRSLLGEGVELEYVGRPDRASPAEGYPAAHAAEQTRIVAAALEMRRSREAPPTMQVAGEAKG
ncbi:MAG TPA: multifunctional oxoglutarate decarboxylase/oxoglutarate dehydrogenase thiamine pyrophosphate-binding subunit/dihydrolipoyllysine-residue succinyltransferase subunit [Gemmatimonadales bacterium]|nr:multifunctional oxoglutarate decarboxylase/oxoglutarate dehydrogenase thiamine pyrophosphate-binding subunit/dihydrolipoyllysine-residue succinyltransferase subunit [Gemmatimonadales bacterium]